MQFRITALNGRIELGSVQTIHQPVNGSARTVISTSGATSRILLNALTTFGDRGELNAAAPETFVLDNLTQAGLTGITVTGLTIP